MIICFDCTRDVKNILDDLRRSEGLNHGEAISIALHAYSVLRSQISNGGSLTLPEGLDDEDFAVAMGEASERLNGVEEVPALFTAPSPSHKVDYSRPPSPEPRVVTSENWFFGQYNKLLPVKATCRALAGLDLDDSSFPGQATAAAIAKEASVLGEILRRYDSRQGARREDSLSSGFPSSGTDAEKSRTRYESQFVGHVNGEGELRGLPGSLRLVTLQAAPQSDLPVRLTMAGWQFASLWNPVLDDLSNGPEQVLSEPECEFLLRHIQENVPEEVSAYRVILEAVSEGRNTPGMLDEAVKEVASEKAAGELSDNFFRTQRSGAVARMIDLQVLARVRSGVNVHFVVTRSGSSFLQSSADLLREV